MEEEKNLTTDPEMPELLVPPEIPPEEPKKEEPVQTIQAEKKIKNGVSLLFAIFLLFMTNAAWYGYMKLYVEPRYDTRYSEYVLYMEEKDKEVEALKESYAEKEAELEEKLAQSETTLTELQEKYDKAIELLKKYTDYKEVSQ